MREEYLQRITARELLGTMKRQQHEDSSMKTTVDFAEDEIDESKLVEYMFNLRSRDNKYFDGPEIDK